MTTPQEFICPITLLPMTDPVKGSDGQTYEREAIVKWLESNPNSPLTRQPMRIDSLQPNKSLKAAMEKKQKPKTNSSFKTNTSLPSTELDYYVALTMYQEEMESQQQIPQPQQVQVQRPQITRQQKNCIVILFLIAVILFFYILFR
jgi:hypothetical protein